MPIYLKSYLDSIAKLDNSILYKVKEYEKVILQSPYDPRFVHLSEPKLRGYRRFKSGRLRIIYAIYHENPTPWLTKPDNDNDVCFAFFAIRTEETYEKAKKALKKLS